MGLHRLHCNDTFQCLNMAASMCLKSFCPWCFKSGENTETIATHLREVHYRLAIAYNICRSFASMSPQVVLEHQSSVQDKGAQEEVQGKEAGRSLLKPAMVSPAGWQDAQDLSSNPADEHGLI